MKNIPETSLVSSFLVFYLVHSMQIGVGILGFQRIVAKTSGNDAWIAILVAGIGIHVLIWMIYKIFATQHGDITDVHRAIFGKWIGGALSSLIIIYCILLGITLLRTYIEIIQVWVFPEFNAMIFSVFFLALVFYIINGGFRAVTGIAFFGVVLPFYIVLAFLFPIKFSFFQNLFPILDHSIKDIAMAAKGSTLSFIGFEMLLIYYPFIKDAGKSQKWAHMGNVLTILLYLIAMIVSIGFFSQEQLERNIWATISMLKIAELPFVERIEYIAISSWILIILPNICIALWGASRVAKRVFNKRQRVFLLLFLAITALLTTYIDTRTQIDMLNNITAQIGFYFIYGYIPFLFVISIIRSKWKEKKA
ncbi:GerAB/ArcD/ProY family transporter [Bacillus suaedaesalsae]|uniref:GerAB/ArcD/ProY family transporter n=1 Tax=Bacillus suaedaesalsae TaxID=2810349 RepID=A0ABS2DF08_9BACI|nr:GerAB/ArcD/ProY family transporter [Bacillus suaedaesalsae]MBM6617046.1 GerAB/ArcD/ProY family transporter [Bacillus suaedaesalsae]